MLESDRLEARLLALVQEAELKHELRLFENLEKETVQELPIVSRAHIVGKALLERGGVPGYRAGRQIMDLVRQMQC